MPVVPSKDGDGYELLKIKPGNSTKVTDYTVLDNENFVEQVNRAVKNFHKQPEHKHDVDGGCVILFLYPDRCHFEEGTLWVRMVVGA